MSRVFTTSVAIGALVAILAGPMMAQETAQPPAEAAATVVVPQVLQAAGLTDVESKPTRHGSRIGGKLPDGTGLDAFLDRQGQLRGLRADGDAALPAALIQQLVPQAVRDQAIFGELARIDAVFTRERSVMVAGQDAQKKPVRAAFSEDGTLLRFGRGDAAGRDMAPRGDHGKHERGDKDHGKRGDRDHGKRGDDRRGDGPRQMGTPPSAQQVRASLTEAGYSAIGQILQQGPVTVAQATNPEGEPVLVEIATDGAVLRELNR